MFSQPRRPLVPTALSLVLPVWLQASAATSSATVSPLGLALELERRIVSGEGVLLPSPDVPVVLSGGVADLSAGDWPEAFTRRDGEEISVSVSPVSGNYEFTDASGSVFHEIAPAAPTTGNWVAPFRRASAAPSPLDPLFEPSRVVLRFVLAGDAAHYAAARRASRLPPVPPRFSPSPETLVTNLRFSAFQVACSNGEIRLEADWPASDAPTNGVLDLYHAPRLDSAAWWRVASFAATVPPTSFAMTWPDALSGPSCHEHDASCVATTNVVVSPLDGATPYTNTVWSCAPTNRPPPAAAFFRLGTRLDTDGDGIPDALETLSLGTDPSTPEFGPPESWPASVAPGLSARPVSPSFSAPTGSPEGVEMLSRSFAIDRRGAWRQYFVAASPNASDASNLPFWEGTAVRLEWSDDLGASGVLATNGFSGAVRIPVSTNATALSLALVVDDRGGDAPASAPNSPALFLLEYEPSPVFPSAENAVATTSGGAPLLAIRRADEIAFIADRTNRPVTLDEPLSAEEELSLPFELPDGATARTDPVSGGIVISGLPCGAYPWLASPAAAMPQASPAALPPRSGGSGGGGRGDGTLLVLDPRLVDVCAHTWRETAFPDAEGYPDGQDYPFEEDCLRDGFLRDETGSPNCGGVISLGTADGGRDALDCRSLSGASAFDGAVMTEIDVGSDTITGRVYVGSVLFWTDAVPHIVAFDWDRFHPERVLSSEGLCSVCGPASCADGECDAFDGPSLGSLRFRVSLGEARAGQHSAFLYLDEDEMPASVAPAAFRLRCRPGADVTDTSPGDGTRLVLCADPHGRTLALSPVPGGSEIAVSITATGEAICSWRVERTDSGVRFRRFALSGATLSDETIGRAPGGGWTLSDAIAGTAETLSLPEPWQEGRKTEWRVLSDASGAVLSSDWVESTAMDTPSGAASRETFRSVAHGSGSWSDSGAYYWEASGLPGRDGLPALVVDERGRSVATDYDSAGRIVLRATSRDAEWLGWCDAFLEPDPLDAIWEGADTIVETFGYAPLSGDSNSPSDAKTPRAISRYLHEPYQTPVLLSREWTTITRGISAPFGFAVRVRTERAGAQNATPGDPRNAVSSVLRYDEAAPGVPLLLRGVPILETDEDGVETRHEHAFGSWDADTLSFTPASGASGAFLRTRTLRAPASSPSGIPGVSTVAETVRDASLGTEAFSCTRAVLSGGALSEPFGWTATTRDARNRVTSVRHHDGTFSSNEWSCCRLLATTDRTGARTLRSSSPALTRVYHAEESVSLASLPHSDKFIPYESPGTESTAIGVTQRWFDGLGRETNTVTRTDITAGASADPARTRTNGVGWFSTNSVAYPAGDSRLSVETDARGVRTRRVTRTDAETGVTTTFADTYAPGVLTDALVAQHTQTEESIPDQPAAHSIRTEDRLDGSSTTLETWDAGAVWIETSSDTLYGADGSRTERSAVASSDGASDFVSLSRYDMLGRLVETDAPGDRRVFSYTPGSLRVAAESNLLSGVASERLYDETGVEIGAAALGVASVTRTFFEPDASNALWRVTRSAEFSGTATNRWTELREQLTRLPVGVLSRVETESSSGEVVSTVVEREGGTTDIRRETSVSNLSGTTVRRLRYGRVIEVTTSEGTTYHCFDAFGRSFTTDHSDPEGAAKAHRTWTGRNSFGDVEEEDVFWRSGNTGNIVLATFFAFDSFGHPVSSTNALGGVTEFAHDFRGNRTSASGATYPALQAYDAANRRVGLSTTRDGTAWDATAWSYDAATGVCTNKTYADGSAVTYTYTPDNLPLRTTQPSGHWTENVYDARRDRIAVLSDDPSAAAAFSRDVFGRETAVSNAAAATVLFRDARGNVTNETSVVAGERFELERGFDEAGRISRIGDVRYGYAEDGRLDTVSNALFRVTYAYTPDRADAGYEIELPGGAVIAREVERDAYRRSLATNIVTSVNGAPVETFAYGYDALGRPVSRNADAFGYNARSEVVSAFRAADNVEDAYSYDGIGNLLASALGVETNAYTANSLNQYTSISNLSDSATPRLCQYDPDGNLVTNGVFAYAYDSASRLTTVTSNGVTVAAFAYDAKSRRVRKTTPAATHTYFYDGWNLIEERIARADGTAATNRYVWGKDLSGSLQGAGGVGGLLAVLVSESPAPNLSTFQPSTFQLFFPCYDNNGNITRYLDATGATVAAFAYDAFGRTLSATGPLADAFPHRFSTKYFDSETGLSYYGYRYYSPSLMRWLNRDPIEEKGGVNLYAFCENGMLHRTDPLGNAYFAYRPLDGLLNIVGVSGNEYDDLLNTVIGHEQLFFEDGKSPSNLGYFADGSVRSDFHSNYNPPHSSGWNDCIMRKAVNIVKPSPYSLLGNALTGTEKYNCQDWAEEVKEVYYRILSKIR